MGYELTLQGRHGIRISEGMPGDEAVKFISPRDENYNPALSLLGQIDKSTPADKHGERWISSEHPLYAECESIFQTCQGKVSYIPS